MILDHFKKIFQGLVKTIALTVVWSAGDNQDEDAGDNQDEDAGDNQDEDAVYSQDEIAVDSQDEDPGDNQDEDDDQDHSIWPTHEFIVKKTKWQSGRLLRCMVAWLRYSCITMMRYCCVARLCDCCVKGCVIVVLQGCVIVLLRARLRDCVLAAKKALQKGLKLIENKVL
jgi:hypothetical protein